MTTRKCSPFRSHPLRNPLLIVFIGLTLVSCSSPKTISRDDMRSDLLAAISLASETDVFVSQLQESRVTPAFAEGHLNYLFKEATRSAKELRQAYPTDDRVAGALENCRGQLNSLATLLADLQEKIGDKERLTAGRRQTARISMILENAKDEL
jgi:hypothetical protein